LAKSPDSCREPKRKSGEKPKNSELNKVFVARPLVGMSGENGARQWVAGKSR
jgi:hypothetical protein